MNVIEIGNLAIALINKDISRAKIGSLTNSAIYYIITMLDCKTALKQNFIELTVLINDLNVILPSNCVSVLDVTKLEANEKYPYNNYIVSRGYISFKNEGKYLVKYTSLPNNVRLDTDIPDIPEIYHRVISEYIIYRNEEDSNPSKSSNALQIFINTCKQIDKDLQQQQENNNYIPVGDFY